MYALLTDSLAQPSLSAITMAALLFRLWLQLNAPHTTNQARNSTCVFNGMIAFWLLKNREVLYFTYS